MVDFFRVELDTLSQYITTLQDAHQQLADLPRLLSGNDNQLGNDKLNAAAEEFQKSWDYGAKQLGEAVTETTDAVKNVQQAYSGADGAVADAVSTLQQPLDAMDQAANQLNGTGAGRG
ncbi:hypothetical protein HC031_19715 [Planosporangium thailandense]|uniref:WXG100 family type VII secretion target n=1 Tax=Planosporangium thailandense TaxID=765197 RepID=A0ABX0Y0Q2_9ACTN|nr:hypothetical protein [Planosporangium thailandense]NJC71926.1 hypothetical protein [Planosporangium thailandense]